MDFSHFWRVHYQAGNTLLLEKGGCCIRWGLNHKQQLPSYSDRRCLMFPWLNGEVVGQGAEVDLILNEPHQP